MGSVPAWSVRDAECRAYVDGFADWIAVLQEDKAKGDSSRRYIKDLPRTFLFFFRTMGLMRGLCATLDVQLPYLDLLAVYARQVCMYVCDCSAHDSQHGTPEQVQLRNFVSLLLAYIFVFVFVFFFFFLFF